MIKLKNKEAELIITIEGYASPFSKDYWDANWLNVKVFLQVSGNMYRTNDPCLLTTELIDLKNFFQAALERKKSHSVEFMEPCLSFRFADGILDMALKYGLNPFYDHDFDSAYRVSFNLNQKELTRVLNALETYIATFPEKNIKSKLRVHRLKD